MHDRQARRAAAAARAAAADFHRRACDADHGVGCAGLVALAEENLELARTLPASILNEAVSRDG